MKQELWQEDQPILRDNLSLAQSSKEEAISERLLDTFAYGVVADSQLLAELIPFEMTVNTIPFSINIGTGVAYDPSGERIIIDSALTYNGSLPLTTTDNGIGGVTPTPQSSGSILVPLTASKVNYVYISYLQTIDLAEFSLQDITNKRLFTKGTDGYKVEVVVDNGPFVGDPELFKPTSNAVFLGVVDIAKVLTITQRHNYDLKQNNLRAVVPDPLTTLAALSKPYAAGQNVSYTEHVDAIGTGVVTPINPHGLAVADLTGSFSGKSAELHEKLFHESGISGVQTSTTSALYGIATDSGGAVIAPTFARDTFLIKKLLTSEAVQINGVTISSTDISQDYLFYFVDAAGIFLDNGLYTIYLDSLTKTLKLAANGSPTNTAYRVYGITTGTFTNLNTTSIASVVANASNFLLWEVQWDSTGVGLGNDNFTVVTDKRFFGTIGNSSLRRDSLTDTITINHNVDFTLGISSNVVPVGSMMLFAGTVVPVGWLECDGASLPITGNYVATWGSFAVTKLHTAIGSVWGAADAGHFNIPDMRGVVPRGWNHGAVDSFADPLDGRVARKTGGNTGDNVGSFQADGIAAHTHTVIAAVSGATVDNAGFSSDGASNGTRTTNSQSPTGLAETRMKNANVMYIIKAY
jgi:microcystin-dependent protein